VLIPLRHENMRGRRWPIITFALIGLNLLIFLLTNGPIEEQQPQRAQVRVQLLLLAATHPELHMSSEASSFVESVKKQWGDRWEQAILSTRAALSSQSGNRTETDDPIQLQEQMDSLCDAFETQQNADIRFPKMKIEMALFLFFFRFKFKAPAYALLPLWVGVEFLYGSVFGATSPVAHWAHVGGFLFGMAGAYGIMRSGLEQKASDAIESKIAWSADADIVRATEALEKSQFDQAATILENHLKQKPTSTDALEMLQQVQWRRNDILGYLQATAQLCQLHLKAQEWEAAWRDYESYTNAGGDKLPAAVWLEIARMLETQQNFERAATEYERLADAHPTEKQSILALVAAGRLCLKKLNRAEEALQCYQKANLSKVPHLDWQPNIEAGLRDAQAAPGTLALKS